jgi:hypothetical protein
MHPFFNVCKKSPQAGSTEPIILSFNNPIGSIKPAHANNCQSSRTSPKQQSSFNFLILFVFLFYAFKGSHLFAIGMIFVQLFNKFPPK